MYHPPDYIDNTAEERKLMVVLRRLLLEWGDKELDVASGFFEPRVWQMLSEALVGLDQFRLLLGRPPELENATGDDGAVDLRHFYRDRLRDDLEKLPLDRQYAALIDDLTAFLQRETVQVRFYERSFLHAKAYLTPHLAIVGSSNFTPSGMTREAELNLTRRDEAVVRDLRQNWFDRMWAVSADHKDDLIEMLELSKFGGAQWTPFDVFIKVLYEYFKDRIIPEEVEARLGVELASFQQEGLREAIRLIDRHGGVIVSDAVENDPPGAAGAVLKHWQSRLDPKGRVAIVHLNPVFSASDYAPRSLTEGVPTVGLRDAESLPTALAFAQFATGAATRADLEAFLDRRAQEFLAPGAEVDHAS